MNDDVIAEGTMNLNTLLFKVLSHGAIFPATCNAILLLSNVNQCRMFDVLRIY